MDLEKVYSSAGPFTVECEGNPFMGRYRCWLSYILYGVNNMKIHNGDHAQFELDNANVPPEQRPDWPLTSFDASDWAKTFCKIAKDKGLNIDENCMVSWFANALMRGFDEAAGRAGRETREFIGWLSADIPELHGVEVPRLADSYDRFRAQLRS